MLPPARPQVVQAAVEFDRSLQGFDDFAQCDALRRAGQPEYAAEAAPGPDQTFGRQPLEDLRQERLRNRRRTRDVADHRRVAALATRQGQNSVEAVLDTL